MAFFIGKFSWTAPLWLKGLNNARKKNPKFSFGIIVVAVIAVGAYLYFDSLPNPVMVKAEFDDLKITPNYKDAKPDNLNIWFEYDFSKLNADQIALDGVPSVARIDLVGQEITVGIKLQPSKKGKWTWITDRHIRFVPETDWPAGTEYKISFDKTPFSKETLFSKNTYQFSTPVFNAEFSQINFYQDPQDISLRRVVSTLKFSHPIDQTTFEKNISMGMRPSGKNITATPVSYNFKLTYDKNSREAYILSEPVKLPDQSNYMKVLLKKGVKSLLGGEGIKEDIETKIVIPDIYSFFKVVNAGLKIVKNEKNEPEQVLMLEFTDDIFQEELLGKFSLYLLPQKGERNGKSFWKGPRQVNENVLSDSKKIQFRVIPNEKNFSKFYSFIIDVPENKYLYIKINKGLISVNKFIHPSFYDSILRSPKYPKEVKIAGEGSILTFSGDHRLSVVSRGVPALKYSVGRLLKNQLYHLVSQSYGDITNPKFRNYSFDEQNLSEFGTKVVDLWKTHPKEANYSSFDLTQYLPEEKNRFGLFFIEVKAWDTRNNREIYGATDNRMVLVTDLGIIVKNNADRTHDIFVQSIEDGNPVEGAKVELLGKNGMVLLDGKTGQDGHVSLPSTKGLSREKKPIVYVVKTADDLSFIPFDRTSRQINLSRFDIGGVRSNLYQRDSLNAFLFTDRGIYRPGEEVNIAIIVKNFDLSNVENIPLELVINGPRNKKIKIKKFNLPPKGFADFQYPTDATADTGRYSASLYLINDNMHRVRQIGRVNFKVEEFQIDTMKIESRLIDVINKGWNTQEKIESEVRLMNLFGTPAQNRKVTGNVIIKPHRFSFDEYKAYKFTDPYFSKDKKPLSLNEMLKDLRTDSNGDARFTIDLEKFRQGTYRLQFVAEGYDQAGGRSVVASNSTLISPLKMLIGYKADGKLDFIHADSERVIEFIAIDNTLKKKGTKDLRLKLIEIKKISTLVRQHNGTYKYQTISKEVEVSSENLIIGHEGFKYSIDTDMPGNFALEIMDSKERRLSRVNYSVVGFANLTGKIDKNAELQLKLNKSDYYPGDIIEISIKAPYSGAGLITIETDRVHQFKWFKTKEESTLQNIRLPENLEGTGYVNVSFVRDIGSKEIYTSPLSYAVQPFSIDKSRRRIDITLETKEIVRPGKPMEIGFATSKPSRIAVFAVDEGILQVAGYATPDPLGHFLKKRSLDVKTLQILDLILPDFNLVKALSASGGGARMMAKAMAKNLNPFTRKTDKPAVFWSGIYDAGPDMDHLLFDIPDTFAGRLRVMAVAVGDESMGAKSTSSIVRGPFVISPNVLTQAVPGDEFLVTVGVANIIDGSGKNAKVDLEISSSKHLEILGDHSAQLIIDEGSEDNLTFRVRAKSLLGAANIKFTARHKNEESSRTASLSIRPATPYYTSFESGFQKSGTIELESHRSMHKELANLSVAASASPLVLVDGLSAYLETFPHGCTEQVVSKVFPLVGLMSHPAYAPHLPDVKAQFSHLIDKLRERQLGDGGFAFWPGNQQSARYPSVYVMHFLLEAREQGYPVPTDMMQRGKDYLKSWVGKSASAIVDARDRANAIYILTRMGEVTTNYLVDLEENLKTNFKDTWKTDILSSYMAATYQLLQKDTEAKRLILGYRLDSDKHDGLDDFHSLLAIDAQYIYLLSKHFEKMARNLDQEKLHSLTKKIFKGEYNTIASAYSILALGAYSKLVLSNNLNENISFKAIDAKGKETLLDAALQPFLKASYGVDTKKIEINGDKPLYYLNVQSGFNNDLPQNSTREGLEIHRDFVDEKGMSITAFEQGKEITVRLKIRALDGRSLQNVAVIDLLPGGFEVIRDSVDRTAYNWRADYVDIREDRVIYYGDFDSSVRELTYRVKLTSAGDFVVPPAYAASMYDRSIRAVSEPGRFNVTASE